MLFIKSSDRLPEREGFYFCKAFNPADVLVKKVLMFSYGEFKEHGKVFDEVEWLDEEASDLPPSDFMQPEENGELFSAEDNLIGEEIS